MPLERPNITLGDRWMSHLQMETRYINDQLLSFHDILNIHNI